MLINSKNYFLADNPKVPTLSALLDRFIKRLSFQWHNNLTGRI